VGDADQRPRWRAASRAEERGIDQAGQHHVGGPTGQRPHEGAGKFHVSWWRWWTMRSAR
jgi:hypothetical protein